MDRKIPFETFRNIWGILKTAASLPQEAFINWELATGLAFELSGQEEDLGEREELQALYREMVEILSPLVAGYGGKTVRFENPLLVFDRKLWILANIENIKTLLKPLSQSYSEVLRDYLSSAYSAGGDWVKKLSGVSLTAEVGLMLGYLSRKVLAQYDLPLPQVSKESKHLLYFVEPNISAIEKRFGLDPALLRFWVCLHELSHAYQFKFSPWLTPYFNSLLTEYLNRAQEGLKNLRERLKPGIKPFSWTRWWWPEILSTPNQSLIGRIQALMSLLEGYSDHVMMRVGKRLPDYEKMLSLFKERKRTFIIRIFETLFGFSLKRQQYQLGERFVSYVVKQKGIDFLNQVWEAQANLPTLKEIHSPQEWITRLQS